jgi:hypothetical protein
VNTFKGLIKTKEQTTMYTQILTAHRTYREDEVYNALRAYTSRELAQLRDISLRAVQAPTEPFDTVEQFDNALQGGELIVWGRHFETKHEFLTPLEFGNYRAMHDVHGHLKTFKASGGRLGKFTFNGEIESLFTLAKDTQDSLIVEGAILETVQRNLQSEVVFFPFTNNATRQMSQDLVRLTAPQF